MKATHRDAASWLLAGASLVLIQLLSGCLGETSGPDGLDPSEQCPDPQTCDGGDACVAPPGCDASALSLPGHPPPLCTDGQTRSCEIILGEHNGITDCMPGVQRCKDGLWTAECVPGP